MAVVVAIDAGTTGIRTIAFSKESKIVASNYREFTQYFPQPGWVEHDATEIWNVTQSLLADLKNQLDAQNETIVSIGITNQRETIIVWDRHTGKPIHHALVWQDRRTADFCLQVEKDGYLPSIREQTGLVLDPYFSASKLRWILSQTDISIDTLMAGTIDTWLIWNLSGKKSHITDATNASRTSLCDIRNVLWSDSLCDVFSIPPSILPQIVPSSGVVAKTAQDSVIGSEIPIAGIAGDQQAALFGQACFEPGMTKNTYGTGSFVLMNIGNEPPKPVEGLLTTVAWMLDNQGTNEITYAYEGAIFSTGSAVQWLRDGLEIISESSEIGPLAESVSDSQGVVMVPAFTGLGSPWWDPFARGTISGITRGVTKAHIARATVEAMALQTRDVVVAMTDASGYKILNLRVDGGASKMDLLLQIQADQLRVSVTRSAISETTALGAAYLSGLATGFWDSQNEIARQWKSDCEATPLQSEADADSLFEQWHKGLQLARS